MPFWLVAASCVFVYMSIFPFIQLANTALVDQFGFKSETAGILYSVPYFMSMVLSPMLGFTIDKVGKRALFITISSVLVAISCFFDAALPTYTSPNYICLGPLILVGFGYSIYASALWSSIPYIVQPRTIGSAFGLVTSLQACGLCVSPLVSGVLQAKYKNTFAPVYLFLGALATIGFLFNIWLYFDDIRNRNGVLNNVPVMTTEAMVTSPTPQRKSFVPNENQAEDELGLVETVDVVEMTAEQRRALKR